VTCGSRTLAYQSFPAVLRGWLASKLRSLAARLDDQPDRKSIDNRVIDTAKISDGLITAGRIPASSINAGERSVHGGRDGAAD